MPLRMHMHFVLIERHAFQGVILMSRTLGTYLSRFTCPLTDPMERRWTWAPASRAGLKEMVAYLNLGKDVKYYRNFTLFYIYFFTILSHLTRWSPPFTSILSFIPLDKFFWSHTSSDSNILQESNEYDSYMHV